MHNGELYAQRFQKSIYLHLSTDCFMKMSLQCMGPKLTYVYILDMYIFLIFLVLLTGKGVHTGTGKGVQSLVDRD